MHQISSYLKTILLLGVLTALLGALGYYFGGLELSLYFLAFGVFLNVITYWFSDKIAILMNRAKPLQKEGMEWLFHDVAEIARRNGIAAPAIYLSPSLQPNAFAAGRSPAKSVVCVTYGLLQTLDQQEVVAVVAHEIGHIGNYDVLLATVAAVVASAISWIANVSLRTGALINGRKKSGAVGLLFLIVAPIAALLIQLAISRAREYAADEAAARLIGKPKALISALMKISESVKRVPMDVNPALSSLYIENPFDGRGILEIFSTHPRLEKRIERLLAMEQKTVK